MVTGTAAAPDGGVAHGALLRRFASAVVRNDPDLPAARQACLETLGERRTVHAAQVVASFDAINRVADATGIEVDDEMRGAGDPIVAELELSPNP